jgi:antitoxin PrlF
MPTSRLSSKGQITLPLEVRHRLGLKQGDRVEFVFEEGRTVVRPASPDRNPFEGYLGALAAFSTQEEVNAWIRDLRDDGAAGEAGR